MDAQTITTLVGTLGFPIVACVAMFQFTNKTVNELKDSINGNTVVLEKLLTKLDMDEHNK